MKRKMYFLAVAFILTLPASAQDAEVTTYFGEKNGFQIDFPNDWTASLVEKKVMFTYNTSVAGLRSDLPGALVFLNVTMPCKNAKSEMKTWVNIFEKGARKSKDAAYKVHEQGEGKTADGKDFSYIDYTYTLIGDDGNASILRRKFCVQCNSFKGTRYQYAFTFQSLETDWEKVKDTYEKIFASVKYK
ncbi:MAG: hypothetical protein JNL40_12225 [Cyclobacteriaceae bacterium]|nr:hypothetical protein [Cyclobacteriaceae bacterium]